VCAPPRSPQLPGSTEEYSSVLVGTPAARALFAEAMNRTSVTHRCYVMAPPQLEPAPAVQPKQ
jgi:hypothetical protein